MRPTNLLTRPLIRSIAILAAALAALAVMAHGDADKSTGATIREPYTPFRITYINFDAVWGPVTLELIWRSRLSWSNVVLESPGFERGVGGFVEYDNGTITRYEPSLGYTTEYTRRDKESCEESALEAGVSTTVTTIPEQWLAPRAFTPEAGWEDLGLDANGYEQYQRVLGAGEMQYKEIYKRDPKTGLVMEVMHVDDSGVTPIAVVLTYEALASTRSAP